MSLPVPPGDEISETRRRNGVVWERPSQVGDPPGSRRFRSHVQIATVYIPDDIPAWAAGGPSTFSDPDTDWRIQGNEWNEGNAFYEISVERSPPNARRVGYRYTSKSIAPPNSPIVDVTLTHLDGVPIATAVGGNVPGSTLGASPTDLEWIDLVPGLDIFIRLREDAVEIRKRIKTPTAPRSLTWQIEHTDGMSMMLPRVSGGRDNFDRSDVGRAAGDGPGRRRRPIEMTHTVTNETVAGGLRSYTWEETWTGNHFARNPVTRVFELQTSGEAYPIEIDVFVSETVAADADDGYVKGDATTWSWHLEYGSSGNTLLWDGSGSENHTVIFRFTTVAIPQGATIDDASLILEGSGASGTVAGTLKGIDSDDCAALGASYNFTHGSYYSSAPYQTTAGNTSQGVVNGTNTIDVAGILQEIVNRPSFASGSDVGMGWIFGLTGGSSAYTYIGDVSGGVSADYPVLEANYTTGGAGISVPVVYHHRQRNF